MRLLCNERGGTYPRLAPSYAERSRIKRGTLRTVRESGRVFVVLADATDQPTDEPTSGATDDRLYDEMQARIRYLERQVEEEREARCRADTLLARLMDQLPQLEAPRDDRERRWQCLPKSA
jgi:hypothetical protein